MVDWIVALLNYLINGVAIVMGWILGLFPNSPFLEPAAPPDSINLGWVTWLIDFPTMIIHASALTTCILMYYAVRVVARWIKLVRE